MFRPRLTPPNKMPTPVILTAIATVGGLEAYALYLGHNGTLFSLALAVIGLLAGAKVNDLWRR